MMTVTVHPTEEVLRTVTEYFPLIKEDEWFADDLVKKWFWMLIVRKLLVLREP